MITKKIEKRNSHEEVRGGSCEEMEKVGCMGIQLPAGLGVGQEGCPVADTARPTNEAPHSRQEVTQCQAFKQKGMNQVISAVQSNRCRWFCGYSA